MSDEPNLTHVLREWSEIFMHRSFADFKRFIDDNGLSPSQVSTLMRLFHDGTCGVKDIGDYLGITIAAASQMVDRLVQQGLILRSEDPTDRRFKQISLTTNGQTVIECSIEARRSWMAKLTHAFSPEEQRTIVEALTMLNEAARQLETGLE